MGIRPALCILFALLVLASPASAATQPFGGLEQFAGALGCISDDGSGGRCADGRALAGVTAVTATPYHDAVYAVSPSMGTLVALDTNSPDGGFTERACFSAAPRAGCTTIPELAGASDVAASRNQVYVTGRDSNAVVAFDRSSGELAYAGCAAAARPGCISVPALDAPTAVAAAPSGDTWVVAGGSVLHLDPGLHLLACFNADASGGCTAARALDGPRDVAVGDNRLALVASSGSNGVALFRDGAQPTGAAGCITQGGTEGCAAGTGLLGAAHVVSSFDAAYVSAPGSGAVTTLRVPYDPGPSSQLASDAAPTAALAVPPWPGVADGSSHAGSHVYAGGAGIVPFRRDHTSDRLTRMAGPAWSPAGAVTDLTLSGDIEGTAVYAAVPSAGAVIAFALNIPPDCSLGFGFGPPPVPLVNSEITLVPFFCFDVNHDPLTYSVATPPARGEVVGFTSDAALYRRPSADAPGEESFTIRASDGGDSTLRTLQVRVSSLIVEPPLRRPVLRLLDGRVRMDRRGRIALRVRCSSANGKHCRVTLAAKRARHTARLRVARAAKIRLKLPKATRRAVRRHPHRGVRLKVTATGRDERGLTGRATRRIRVLSRRSP